MTRAVYIYGLADPISGQVRYVGKTVQSPTIRLSQHICHRSRNRTKCSSWIRHLQNKGLQPEMFILEESNESAWREAEQFWIASLRLAGCDLCNLTDGGLGPSGYRLSEERKHRIAFALRGCNRSDETRHKISLAKIGKPRPDVGEKNRANAKLSDAAVEKIRDRLVNGESGRLLATAYAVSPALICLIGQGKRRTLAA
ncbi:MAG TPA: NUMOD3 domain-containing DNA-binding protein, partial [Burkholderiales bacterium]|nr:NUMOD3 domain-containing DNA-binding protein [Burkholderiales bacterium]